MHGLCFCSVSFSEDDHVRAVISLKGDNNILTIFFIWDVYNEAAFFFPLIPNALQAVF